MRNVCDEMRCVPRWNFEMRNVCDEMRCVPRWNFEMRNFVCDVM
jgi:hypothetical protein